MERVIPQRNHLQAVGHAFARTLCVVFFASTLPTNALALDHQIYTQLSATFTFGVPQPLGFAAEFSGRGAPGMGEVRPEIGGQFHVEWASWKGLVVSGGPVVGVANIWEAGPRYRPRWQLDFKLGLAWVLGWPRTRNFDFQSGVGLALGAGASADIPPNVSGWAARFDACTVMMPNQPVRLSVGPGLQASWLTLTFLL